MKNTNYYTLLAILIILLFAVYGCGGTRNTDVDKKQDIKIKNTYSQGDKIILGNTFTYTPFNSLKPMQIDNKTYSNVIISNDKSIVKTKWNNKTEYKTITIEKTKIVTRTNHDYLYLGMFLIICAFVFLYFYLPKLKTGI